MQIVPQTVIIPLKIHPNMLFLAQNSFVFLEGSIAFLDLFHGGMVKGYSLPTPNPSPLTKPSGSAPASRLNSGQIYAYMFDSKSQIPLRYLVRSLSQTCSELKFGLSILTSFLLFRVLVYTTSDRLHAVLLHFA